MADPNTHTHHRLNQQPQLVSGAGVPHLILDSQVAINPPPHIPPHQFPPQPYSVLDNFWQQQFHEIRHGVHDFKVHQLPLARIKKVMKTDEEVKMISAEAPILFAKGCDIFITELTMRAWHHAEECKRRTLQRSDIANAIKKVDMFDFLIDIVPREDKVSVKTEKMEYQDHPNQYPYGLSVPPSGHQFNASPNIPVDHKIMVDPMTALHEQQQHLQHMQYMRMEPQHHHQVLHDHSEHQQHQHPPNLLPPLAPVAGQQVPSYRARPQYAPVSTDVSTGPSVRQVTTEQPYQHPHYYNHNSPIQNFQQHSQELHHHRQSDHNPVQVKYEIESSVARPVEWYSQPSSQLANNGHHTRGYVQGNSHVSNSSHGYGQPLSQSHDYNHDSTGVRHEEGYVRGGGVQRN